MFVLFILMEDYIPMYLSIWPNVESVIRLTDSTYYSGDDNTWSCFLNVVDCDNNLLLLLILWKNDYTCVLFLLHWPHSIYANTGAVLNLILLLYKFGHCYQTDFDTVTKLILIPECIKCLFALHDDFVRLKEEVLVVYL